MKTIEKTVPESTYRKHVLRGRSTHNTFIVQRDWALVMTIEEAVFLQDVANRISLRNTPLYKIEEEDGVCEFGLCTEKYLMRPPFSWNSKIQKRLLNKLIEREYVRTIRRGLPARRYVYIDIKKIESDIDDVFDSGETDSCEVADESSQLVPNGTNWSVPNQTNCLVPNGTEKKDTTTVVSQEPKNVQPKKGDRRPSAAPPLEGKTPRNGGGTTSPKSMSKSGKGSRRCQQPGIVADKKKEGKPKEKKERKIDAKHIDAAKKLYDALRENRRFVSWNCSAWSQAFRTLGEHDKQDYTQVLDWFCQNCQRGKTIGPKKKKVPTIKTGSQFREHYEWIEDLMTEDDKSKWDYSGSTIDGPSRKLTDWRDLQ